MSSEQAVYLLATLEHATRSVVATSFRTRVTFSIGTLTGSVISCAAMRALKALRACVPLLLLHPILFKYTRQKKINVKKKKKCLMDSIQRKRGNAEAVL